MGPWVYKLEFAGRFAGKGTDMKRKLSCLYVLLLAGCVSYSPGRPQAASPTTTIITGVSVIDAERGVASGPSDIFIRDGRIQKVTTSSSVRHPSTATIIDGSGQFALPGLIDTHAHIGEGGIVAPSEISHNRALGQFLRYGVTTIFVPGGTSGGNAELNVLKDQCRSSSVSCPEIFGSASIITAPGSHPVSTIFNFPADVPDEIVEARGVTVLRPGTNIDALVAAKQKAGADAIKIVIEDGPPPWYPKPRLRNAEIAAIVKAAHKRGLKVFAHVSKAEHVQIALDEGVDGIMHAPIDRLSDELIKRMASAQMWYVPTFALYDGILTWALKKREADAYALQGVDPSVIESLANPGFLASAAESVAGANAYNSNASDNLRRAVAAGVPVALGTDVNNPFVFPGYSVHEELALMVRAGLSPREALKISQRSAEMLGASARLGKVEAGYEADILLLRRNPLEDIKNSRSITVVLSDGRIVDNPVGQN